MKTWSHFLAMASLVGLGFVSPSWGAQTKEYKFNFSYGGQKLQISESSNSWEQSFERASLKCFQHFSKGQPLSQEKGLDLIDVCANPKG